MTRGHIHESHQDWLVRWVAERAGVAAVDIDIRRPFSSYGLESLEIIGLMAELSARLGRTLPATMLWEYPTIEAVIRSFVEGERGRDRTEAARPRVRADEPIAIIGLACRLPMAPDARAFWRLLVERRDAIIEVPAERWPVEAYYSMDPEAPGRMVTRWGGFLEGIDQFDPLFFGISPAEATQMDPQQRLMLALSCEALEHAAVAPTTLRGARVGVFVGAWKAEYGWDLPGPGPFTSHTATGQDLSIIAGRVSYVLGLEGPSLVVSTACSSSLVALHLACQSLRQDECDMALVGGVNLLLSPLTSVAMSKFGGLSPDGRCRAFDASANGYVRSEGAGVVVLKPLARALADGDPVQSVVLGSAVNNDGLSNGLTAPSLTAQQAVLREAYRRAGVSPERVGYVETHGTGTRLGDPIEARALATVLGTERAADRPLLLGAVKTNIGHLEAAAGIAGLIKTVLVLRHREIPPNLHFHTPNPHIPFDEWRLKVPAQQRAWPEGTAPAIAGVSSFGFGGTNSHVVLSEPPRSRAMLLPLGAQEPDALRALARQVRELALANAPLLELSRRAAAEWSAGQCRRSLVFRSRAQLLQQLQALADEAAPAQGPSRPDRDRLVFVFSGQGAQWAQMGCRLLDEPVFRASLKRCDRLMRQHAGWSLLEELVADPARSRLERIDIQWPVLFALGVALADLWRSWGIEPDAVVGHSIGEVAAAYAAGALGLEEAVRVICHQGRLAARTSGRGAMALVSLDWEQATALVERLGSVRVAIENSPTSTVISGEEQAVAALVAELHGRNVPCHLVRTSVAAHGAHMEPLGPELAEALHGIEGRRPRLPMLSTVTGAWLDGPADAAYWVRNFLAPVRFSSAVQSLVDQGYTHFLELGAHRLLQRPIEEVLSARGCPGRALASMHRDQDERERMLRTLGALHALQRPVRWEAVLGPMPGSGGAPCVLPLSARSPEALQKLATAYADYLERGAGTQERIADVCYTASVRRSHHEYRCAVTAAQPAGMAGKLRTATQAQMERARRRKLAFVFPGQGSQWLGMCRELLRAEPSFREQLEACGRAIRRWADCDVIAELDAPEHCSRLGEIGVVQPILFAVQVALSALWRSWGVAPDGVVGHSMGEVAAACVAGGLDLEQAARIICVRSRLLERVSGQGAMAVVGLALPDAQAALRGHETRLSVAVSNSPGSTVLSGDTAALEEVMTALQARNVFCRRVKVDVASHSPQVESLRDELLERLAGLQPQPGRTPLYSTVEDCWKPGQELDVAYWWRNLREPVRFGSAVDRMRQEGFEVFLELSPHPVLLSPMEEVLGPPGVALASLRRGEGEQQAMRESLGRLYTLGHEVDWQGVHREGGRVVEVPTYAWHSKRYWYSGGTRQRPVEARDSSAFDEWLYEVRWQRAEPGQARPLPDHWLLLEDARGVGRALAARLQEQGRRCLRAVPADARGRRGDLIHVRPDSRDDLAWLLAEAGAGSGPVGVAHLWSLDFAAGGALDIEALEAAQRLGSRSLLALVQAVVEAGAEERVRLWGVTSGAVPVAGRYTWEGALHAPLWGLGKVVGLEHPGLWGALVDVDGHSADADARAVLAELCAAGEEDHTAYRDGRRYVARLERSAPPAATAPLRCAEQGSYLVTGGLGRLGLTLAQWLVDHGARHLALVGRRGPEHLGEEQRRQIEALRTRGAEVQVFAADVASLEQMRRVLEQIERSGNLLRGVVHAAGSSRPGPLAQLGQADWDAVVRPKLHGTWVLHEITRERPLQFFILFSSAAAVWGGSGLGAYAAANAFLDATAWARRQDGQVALSIGWGRWPRGGMIASEQAQAQLEQTGLEEMPAARALEVLESVLGSGAIHRTVARVDWSVFKPLYEARRPRPLLERLGTRAAPAPRERGAHSLIEQLRNAPAGEQRLRLQRHVQAEVARVLGLERPDELEPRQGFFQLGMDSMVTVLLRKRLQELLDVPLPSTLAFEYPTVEALTAYLAQQLLAPEPPARPVAAPAPVRPDSPPAPPLPSVSMDALSEEELLAQLEGELAAAHALLEDIRDGRS